MLLTLLTFAVSPQTIAPPAPTDDAEKLEKDAVELLRETVVEVDGMRSVENRISFISELASLMWFHDEREARSMYAGVISDFRQLMAQYDSQMNSYGIKPIDEPESYGPFFMGEPSERQKVERKFRTAVGVRQSIAMNMAEHDAELALNFYYDSLSSISNPDLRKQMEGGDKSFEQQLISQISATDPAKATQMGKKSLEKGFSYQHLDLLKKVYANDVDKGIEFGAALLSRVKGERSDALDISAVSSLLKYGTDNLDEARTSGGKKAVFSDADLRDIAEAYAQAVLARPAEMGLPYANYAKEIERWQPGRAAQIRAKAQSRTINVRAINAPPPIYRGTAANANMSVGYGQGNGSGASPENAARLQREANEKKMFDDVAKLGTGKLSTDQREKIIQQARKTLMSTPGRDKKVAGLSLLAAQVAKAGNKDLASEIMRDAASFVNPQPKNYQDFLLSWILATGYATAEPDKAFPLLDETITRANDLITAFIKVGEFIDVTEEVISDGELQVGAFGGSMVRDLTRQLSMADSTIKILAKADFAKTRDLTNRFDRPEVRILAKMMVLRTVLGPKENPSNGDGFKSATVTKLPGQ